MAAFETYQQQKQSCLQEQVMKLEIALVFLELLLEYFAELKTNDQYRFLENVSVPLGLPKITQQKETGIRMNFPKGKGNQEGIGKSDLHLYAWLVRPEKSISLLLNK